MTGKLWKLPQPMRGDAEGIMLWTQVITGLEVDELTAVRVLDAATWHERNDKGAPGETRRPAGGVNEQRDSRNANIGWYNVV